METVRKSKVTSETTIDETIEAIEEITTAEVAVPLQLQPEKIMDTPDYKQVIAEAPELYGIAPTVQQIEEFKQKESLWRAKLKSL